MSLPFISANALRKEYRVRRNPFGKGRTLHAVAGVSFALEQGETFGLVGESGSGKSTIAKVLLAAEPATAGSIHVAGHVLDAGKRVDRQFHRDVQPVLQDPYSSLNPLMRIEHIVDEPMRVHGLHRGKALRGKVHELLDLVGLTAEMARRHPHELSGGQRQRVAIARALGVQPKVLVLDEPVSALDVSIQAQVLNLLRDMQTERGLTYLLISHDLAVVAYMSTKVGVLYLGELMEIGPSETVVGSARHPYTQTLITASESRVDASATVAGEIPSPIDLPSGCRFEARCIHATARCRTEKPLLRPVSQDHWIACHLDIPALSAPPSRTAA
ncbi:peptide ABC transporter ATP-binding protein [Bordetella genomosp. 10]|uniref:Peptide ABC transporter ATP-binding protein n=1 Tax=Bordetella genomosp. 10 TaxID=1416804 RepID=A0A261SC48_9BORD|nr:oligopeptide/dipeptide ABC transporter ATP-binding protein [Bordetella genomosp. 10]OZI34651.1 peptide ABC transporter ATP-binding protein [Bordetella genomosp. 10]